MALAESLTPRPPRVLVYDIETSPHLVWTYNLHDTSIRPDQIVTPSRLLCWAGKWTDSQQVMYYSEHHNSRREMVEALWHALNDADVVVGYNHRGFDNKHAMREFVTSGLGPPSPWVDVDLLKENRRLFKFASNRLGYVTETLGLPTKLDTGTGLWRKVLEGDEKAWAKFKAYNVADVRATQALLEYLAPYVRNVHLGLFTGDPTCCPTCGGTDLTPMGKTYTRTAAYPQLMCGCGAWCKVLANGQTRPI
jgi:DNA polymerase elongation subunit (family B)